MADVAARSSGDDEVAARLEHSLKLEVASDLQVAVLNEGGAVHDVSLEQSDAHVDVGSSEKRCFLSFVFLVDANDEMRLFGDFERVVPLRDHYFCVGLLHIRVPDELASQSQLIPVCHS